MDRFCFVQLYHISERGGGAEVQANYLSLELVERGKEVHYICQTTDKAKENTSSKICGVNIHWMPLGDTLSRHTFSRIEELLIKLRPHIIIERMSSSFGLPIVRARNKIAGKYIWICTDNYSPLVFKSIYKNYRKLTILKFLFILPRAFRIDMIRLYVNKKADIVLSQNDLQKRLIHKNFGRKSHRMISGHPLSKLSVPIENRFNKKIILWCANFGTHKRPELFIELATKMQHTNYKFIMVGGHSDKNYVAQLLAEKPDNLTVTGSLNFDDALCYFNEATVFVNTSAPGGDGFPNTFIQAWLRQVPVLSFGFDPDSIIVNNDLGFKVSKIEEAIEHLEDLFNNQSKYEVKAYNSYKYALENHSIKKMTDNFLEAINNYDK